jgi:hypothetical protein
MDGTGMIVDNDADDDTACNDTDNCLDIPNTDQANLDGDSFGNICDAEPYCSTNDTDECGICGGDGPEAGLTCDGTPLEFVYNVSIQQAFYYIETINDFNGDPLTADDWVGAFSGEICVGSRKWDTSQCNSGLCDVPVMGDDGYDYSEGYLNSGDMPDFKIFDASEGEYFVVYPNPENYAFEANMIFNIDELVYNLNYSIPLHNYNNLISFYVLPEDIMVNSVMLDIQDNITAVFGEAVSAQYFSDGNFWTGSLMNIDLSSGYWLRMSDADTLDGSGHPLNPERVYDLHSGANLVSFPSPGSVDLSLGLPDDIEDHVIAVIGEGVSAVNLDFGWTGALMNFEGLHGYWIITDSDISFSYDLSNESLSRKSNPYKTAEQPEGFEFAQSAQLFYMDLTS